MMNGNFEKHIDIATIHLKRLSIDIPTHSLGETPHPLVDWIGNQWPILLQFQVL